MPDFASAGSARRAIRGLWTHDIQDGENKAFGPFAFALLILMGILSERTQL